ncbi:MAG: helix-turn-helix domain-containing protein [Lentisphaeria bacterium]
MNNRNRYSPGVRRAVVDEVSALKSTRAQKARLAELGVSWGSFFRWRRLLQTLGPAGLEDRIQGRPRGRLGLEARLTALEDRVGGLERAHQG